MNSDAIKSALLLPAKLCFGACAVTRPPVLLAFPLVPSGSFPLVPSGVEGLGGDQEKREQLLD